MICQVTCARSTRGHVRKINRHLNGKGIDNKVNRHLNGKGIDNEVNRHLNGKGIDDAHSTARTPGDQGLGSGV
eukprot:1994014-Rhodomonas_salina.2